MKEWALVTLGTGTTGIELARHFVNSMRKHAIEAEAFGLEEIPTRSDIIGFRC